MQKNLIFTLLALLVFITTNAKADILFEPLAGYTVGTLNSSLNVPSNPASNQSAKLGLNGMSYGGRLGWQGVGLQLGVDYLGSNYIVDGDSVKMSEYGTFVGYEFPILFRVYAGYVLAGKMSQSSFAMTGAKGPKAGLGFSLLSFVDLNLEYRSITMDQYKTSLFAMDVKYSALMLSLSIPITF